MDDGVYAGKGIILRGPVNIQPARNLINHPMFRPSLPPLPNSIEEMSMTGLREKLTSTHDG
jgi:hypothetical protein